MRDYLRIAFDRVPIAKLDSGGMARRLQRSLSYPARWRLDHDFYALPFELSLNRKLKRYVSVAKPTFDAKQLSDVLAERLSSLDIPSVYLVTYEQPTDAEVPEIARLRLAYTDQKCAALEPDGLRFSTDQVIPPDFLPQGRRYSLVVEPLYFQDKSLGYVVFEIGPRQGNLYELLRNNLSSALQGATLFQEASFRQTAEAACQARSAPRATSPPHRLLSGFAYSHASVTCPCRRTFGPASRGCAGCCGRYANWNRSRRSSAFPG